MGQGPYLVATFPESSVTRLIRAAVVIAAFTTGVLWLSQVPQLADSLSFGYLSQLFLAGLRSPDLQTEMLDAFAASLICVSLLYLAARSAGLGHWLRQRFGGGRIRVGGVSIPRATETNHFLLAGSTGTGKTELALGMARTVSERGDRAVFIDYCANFLSRVCRGGDFILNPFDQRSVCWSPWLELRVTDRHKEAGDDRRNGATFRWEKRASRWG